MVLGWRLNWYLGWWVQVTAPAGSAAFTYIFIHSGSCTPFQRVHALDAGVGHRTRTWLQKIPRLFPVLRRGGGAMRFSYGSIKPVVGASGAIYNLLYAFAALYPEQTIYMYFLFHERTPVRLPMAGLSLVLSFATLNSGVANFTHLSGLAAGWLYFKVPLWPQRVRRQSVRKQRKRRSGRRTWWMPSLRRSSSKGEGALTATERRELDAYARSGGRGIGEGMRDEG